MNTELLDKYFNYTYLNANEWVETDSGIELEIDIPGIKKDEVSIKSKGESLVIAANPKSKNGKPFSYSYKLPSVLDGSLTFASLEDGVLKVTVPKKESAKIKEISVKIS